MLEISSKLYFRENSFKRYHSVNMDSMLTVSFSLFLLYLIEISNKIQGCQLFDFIVIVTISGPYYDHYDFRRQIMISRHFSKATVT